MSAISNILNLTSGILGDALDIRIVATTNADHMDMDPALLREMRLIARMSVGKLTFAKSVEVVARLTGTPVEALTDSLPKLGSLAACYKYAREHGWTPPPSKIKKKKHEFSKSSLMTLGQLLGEE